MSLDNPFPRVERTTPGTDSHALPLRHCRRCAVFSAGSNPDFDLCATVRDLHPCFPTPTDWFFLKYRAIQVCSLIFGHLVQIFQMLSTPSASTGFSWRPGVARVIITLMKKTCRCQACSTCLSNAFCGFQWCSCLSQCAAGNYHDGVLWLLANNVFPQSMAGDNATNSLNDG
jgi:hypothetical protein